MFAVNEAECSCLICRIILATLKGPFECYFLVNLSDVRHNQLNGETNSWLLWQLSAYIDLGVWSEHSGLMNSPTVFSPAY